MVSLKLIDSLLHWAIWVWALAEDIVLTVSLGKTFYSYKASLDPGVEMGTSKFNAEGNPVMG